MRVNNEYHRVFSQAIRDVFGVGTPKMSGTFMKKENLNLDGSFIELGDTYIHLKKYQEAMNCYHEAFRINPGNFMAFSRLVLFHSHFIYSGVDDENGNENKLNLQVSNDIFRQTFIGGYVLLSRQLNGMLQNGVNTLLTIIQNLDTDYFETQGGSMRDYGFIECDGKIFSWMINHIDSIVDKKVLSIPVLIVMSKEEYACLHTLINDTFPCSELKS